MVWKSCKNEKSWKRGVLCNKTTANDKSELPTCPFTICEEIDNFYVILERRATDFYAPKSCKGRSVRWVLLRYFNPIPTRPTLATLEQKFFEDLWIPNLPMNVVCQNFFPPSCFEATKRCCILTRPAKRFTILEPHIPFIAVSKLYKILQLFDI